MKAYFVPFKLGNCLAFGDSEGHRLKGPILYVPQQGAIFYESSLMGDSDGMGIATVGVDSFESTDIFLQQLGRQIKGETLETPYDAEKFNLSRGVLEVDIPEAEFHNIATEAKIAYNALDKFRDQSFRLISGLEEKLRHKKLVL